MMVATNLASPETMLETILRSGKVTRIAQHLALVLYHLTDRATGIFHGSLAELEAITGWGRSTIYDHLRELEDFIDITRGRGRAKSSFAFTGVAPAPVAPPAPAAAVTPPAAHIPETFSASPETTPAPPPSTPAPRATNSKFLPVTVMPDGSRVPYNRSSIPPAGPAAEHKPVVSGGANTGTQNSVRLPDRQTMFGGANTTAELCVRGAEHKPVASVEPNTGTSVAFGGTNTKKESFPPYPPSKKNTQITTVENLPPFIPPSGDAVATDERTIGEPPVEEIELTPAEAMAAALDPEEGYALRNVRWQPDGRIVVSNGIRQEFLSLFDGDEKRLDLALVQAAGYVGERMVGKRLLRSLRAQLAREAGQKIDRDRRYARAAANNGKRPPGKTGVPLFDAIPVHMRRSW